MVSEFDFVVSFSDFQIIVPQKYCKGVHIAGGFQRAGILLRVAMLWEGDYSIAKEFYKEIMDGTRIVVARTAVLLFNKSSSVHVTDCDLYLEGRLGVYLVRR